MSDGITTASVEHIVSLGGPDGWAFRVTTDRNYGARGLTKGKDAGLVVAPTLPQLLRNVARLAEQDDGTLDAVARALREATS